MKRLGLVTLLFLASALTACGFALRGANGQASLPFRSVYLGFGEFSPLGIELRRTIRGASDTQVVTDRKAAEAIVEVLSEARQKNILTLNTQGRVREYSLIYRFNFQVRNRQDVLLLPPTEIVLRRDITFNEAQVIAKEKEEELLYRDMQSDLVQQILRRLAAIKPL